MARKKYVIVLKRAQTMEAVRKGIKKTTVLLATEAVTARENTLLTRLLQALAEEHKKLQDDAMLEDVPLDRLIGTENMIRNLARISSVMTVHQLAMCPPTLLRKGLRPTTSRVLKTVLLEMQTAVALAVDNKPRKLRQKKINK